ncbi:MAG: DUF3883 domain-containing protein [Verrucomicrobiota bacterium]
MVLQLEDIPTTAEWREWLNTGERKLRELYLLSPERLISEYRHEREITRGYHGREILELLQNAGDAAHEANIKARVRIIVSQEGVVIGNTGRPFDVGGVKSLQTANLSPKRQRQKAVIGDKGLGFRSILNWTACPLISSGELHLAFLPTYADRVVTELQLASRELTEWVTKEQRHANGLIVPRLAFPQIVVDWDHHEWGDPKIRHVATQCQALRNEGFDSIVGMPFAFDDAHAEALRQIDELGPEILIFVDTIDCLEIETGGSESRKTWQRSDSGAFVSVRENGQSLGEWSVFAFNGEVPESLLDQEDASQTDYHITIGVPSGTTQASSSVLHCYFPTEVEIPLPIVCHATLRLDETRKHLTDTQANRFILGQLASHIANIAETMVGPDEPDDWAACNLIFPSGDWGSELKKFGIPEKLKAKSGEKEILPTLGGSWCQPRLARLAPGSRTDWLPPIQFPDVAKVETARHRKISEYFGLEVIPARVIAERLATANALDLESRASAIAGLLEEAKPDVEGWPASLLLDETGEIVPEGCPVILQPSEQMPRLPDWARISFLHQELRLQVAALLKVTEGRELQQKLKVFGVIEYSLAALIGPVIADSNRIIRVSPEREEEIRGEALVFLFGVHRALVDQGSIGAFPDKATVKLPSQAGEYRASIELYLGSGFGIEGTISQDLFGGWGADKLLAGNRLPVLDGTAQEIVTFLLWLGVARWPRELIASPTPPEFLEFIIQSIIYPIRFKDYEFQSPDGLPSPLASNFRSLDSLDEILQNAPPAAILGWVLIDERVSGWSTRSTDHGQLSVDPKGVHYRRVWEGTLPGYIHWRISNTEWLPCTSGACMAPTRCLLGERLIENLFPRPADPGIELCSQYGIHNDLSNSFQRVGVLPGLAYFRRDEVYRILLEMPESSPDGKTSKALCRWLLQHDTDLYGALGEYQKRFFQEGRMWGTQAGVQEYFPVSNLRHVDSDGFPTGLRQKLCVADLPKRVGSDKVERIFGIKAVEREGVSQRLIDHRISPSSVVQEYSFDQAKPFLTRLRQAQTTQNQYFATLERLKLVLCDEVLVRLIYEGETHDYSADYWEWFIFEDTLYIRCEIEEAPDLLADAIGSAIAAVFRVGDGDAFAKMFRCEPSNRSRLLRKMSGDDFQSEIDKAKRAHSKGCGYRGPIEPLKKRSASSETPNIEDGSGDETSPPDEGVQSIASSDQPQDMPHPGITPVDHVPVPAQTRRNLIVRKVERRSATTRNLRVVADGELCERKAMEFEEADCPPRYPLLVGPITGIDAPGCDILSFSSPEERSTFLDPTTRNYESVARFIEVKGRSCSTAKIELSGNELTAAQRIKERYYLYRLHESEDDVFSFSILHDPLADQSALTPAIYINFESATRTERYVFVSSHETTDGAKK